MNRFATSHFWIGQFSEALLEEYLAEVWDEDDENRDQVPLSPFGRDQGETWYDHDFLETNFIKGVTSIKELIEGSSYSVEWSEELTRRIAEAGLNEFNTIIFIDQEQIGQPQSVQGDGYWLRYLGTIKYAI